MADDTTTPPIIALDTNALVQSIPTRGRFRPMIEGFDAGRFLLVVSNEILLEYEEILKAIGGPTAWSAFESLLIARATFVRRVDPTYFWKAIVHDPDDDNSVDSAVPGDADWIVTEDTHDNVLFQKTRLTAARSIRRSSSSAYLSAPNEGIALSSGVARFGLIDPSVWRNSCGSMRFLTLAIPDP